MTIICFYLLYSAMHFYTLDTSQFMEGNFQRPFQYSFLLPDPASPAPRSHVPPCLPRTYLVGLWTYSSSQKVKQSQKSLLGIPFAIELLVPTYYIGHTLHYCRCLREIYVAFSLGQFRIEGASVSSRIVREALPGGIMWKCLVGYYS